MTSSPSTAVAHRPVAGPNPRIDEFADEMVSRWRRGERPMVEEFLARDAELAERPEAVFELLAEELVLRSEHDMPTTAEELGERFPQWKAQVAALIDCHRELAPHLLPIVFPEVGDDLGEFHLTAELGRGAHGRVYLAAQQALADRPVVLKMGPWSGGEHLSLARLQHTHIVPLYSVHEFPDRGLRGLCMPYFGGATLAALLADGSPTRGKDLLARLPTANDGPVRGPAWAFLEQATAAEAICWIGACLADALQYAHDRILLHLDLKPSNVLIASDGTPMLLDFHLARPPLAAGELAPMWLGGTIGCMAPEQSAAMRAVAARGTLPQAVDARADVFALGMLLAESLEKLGGRNASIGLTDILQRATATELSDRYSSAGALAIDLRRHLSNMPLKGVGNRSLAERWSKWRRRRPFALPLALTLAALFTLSVGLILHAMRQAAQARDALRSGEVQLADGRYREAANTFASGESLLNGLPFQSSLRKQLRETRRAADRGLVAGEVHRVCEQVRPLYAAEEVSPAQAKAAAIACRSMWDRRREIAEQLGADASGDLVDLGILTASLESRSPDSPMANATALGVLQEAEELFGPSAVLYLERARIERLRGRAIEADDAERKSRGFPPQTAWEHLAVGRAELAAGENKAAANEFDRSLELDPRSIWANYYRGVCSLRMNQPIDALARFSVCVALTPESAWCWHNRALAYERAGLREKAIADLRRAMQLDPQNGAFRELFNKLTKQ